MPSSCEACLSEADNDTEPSPETGLMATSSGTDRSAGHQAFAAVACFVVASGPYWIWGRGIHLGELETTYPRWEWLVEVTQEPPRSPSIIQVKSHRQTGERSELVIGCPLASLDATWPSIRVVKDTAPLCQRSRRRPTSAIFTLSAFKRTTPFNQLTRVLASPRQRPKWRMFPSQNSTRTKNVWRKRYAFAARRRKYATREEESHRVRKRCHHESTTA